MAGPVNKRDGRSDFSCVHHHVLNKKVFFIDYQKAYDILTDKIYAAGTEFDEACRIGCDAIRAVIAPNYPNREHYIAVLETGSEMPLFPHTSNDVDNACQLAGSALLHIIKTQQKGNKNMADKTFNLKDAFRYQNFLDALDSQAAKSMAHPGHYMETTKLHKRREANPGASDVTETVDFGEFFDNDTLLQFRLHLLQERSALIQAITTAKQALTGCIGDEFGGNIDAAISVNKSRRDIAATLRTAIKAAKTTTVTDHETAYMINGEGNQVPYTYEVEVTKKPNFDVTLAKATLDNLLWASDDASDRIERAMITAVVPFTPAYNVNGTFEDAVDNFVQNINVLNQDTD